jgi:signal transduction histidine kinase
MVIDVSPRHSPSSDAVVAVAAGPLVWMTDERVRTLSETVALAGCSMALLGQFVTLIGLTAWNSPDADGLLLGLSLGGCLVCLALAALQVAWVGGGHGVTASTSFMILVRVLALAIFAVGWIVLAPGFAAALIWPLGVYAGLEYSVTASFVGVRQSARSALARVMASPLHAGALVGLVTASLIGGRTNGRLPLELAFALEVVMVAAVASYGAMNRLSAVERSRDAEVIERARAGERHRRAHWIHDDVCADLRNVRIKVATRVMTSHEIAVELDELDYRMRVRQLDEILEGGSVSAAEILQPYLRRVQNAGVRLMEVPRYEDASIEVPASAATVLRRATAGLVNNAVAAKCTKLSIRLHHQPGWISLSVEDDAGGFDLSSIPAGRGLSALANEVGQENLSVERGAEGAVVIVNISMGALS